MHQRPELVRRRVRARQLRPEEITAALVPPGWQRAVYHNPELWWPGRCVIFRVAGMVATTADSVVILDAARLYAESASGRVPPTAAGQPVGVAVVWTFQQQDFPAQGPVRVHAGASGYVHAGFTQAGGRWDPVYHFPLIPAPDGTFEAVLPPGVDAFTFFWTAAPETPGHPGHWEREDQGGQIFRRTSPRQAAADMPPAPRAGEEVAKNRP